LAEKRQRFQARRRRSGGWQLTGRKLALLPGLRVVKSKAVGINTAL
jgi:hypothetical protein